MYLNIVSWYSNLSVFLSAPFRSWRLLNYVFEKITKITKIEIEIAKKITVKIANNYSGNY